MESVASAPLTGKCIEIKEDIFYLEKGKYRHAGKRTIIGEITRATIPGFYNIEVIASEGPNSLLKGTLIQRPAGNLINAKDCSNLTGNIFTRKEYKAGGHVEGIKNGKKIEMDNARQGGIGKGASHAGGGIQGSVGTQEHPIEFEGEEIILTAPVADDSTLYEFEGKKMTPRQIASQLNVDNGGVAFAEGGDVHSCRCSGKSYNFGGKTVTDFYIVEDIRYGDAVHKGEQEEKEEHYDALSKLNAGTYTIGETIDDIVNVHLKKDPHFYDWYSQYKNLPLKIRAHIIEGEEHYGTLYKVSKGILPLEAAFRALAIDHLMKYPDYYNK